MKTIRLWADNINFLVPGSGLEYTKCYSRPNPTAQNFKYEKREAVPLTLFTR